MDISTVVDIGMVVAFAMAFVEYTIQTVRIYKERSSKDFSLWSTSLRLLGMILVLGKVITLNAHDLIVGQSILVLLFIINTIFVFKFHKPR